MDSSNEEPTLPRQLEKKSRHLTLSRKKSHNNITVSNKIQNPNQFPTPSLTLPKKISKKLKNTSKLKNTLSPKTRQILSKQTNSTLKKDLPGTKQDNFSNRRNEVLVIENQDCLSERKKERGESTEIAHSNKRKRREDYEDSNSSDMEYKSEDDNSPLFEPFAYQQLYPKHIQKHISKKKIRIEKLINGLKNPSTKHFSKNIDKIKLLAKVQCSYVQMIFKNNLQIALQLHKDDAYFQQQLHKRNIYIENPDYDITSIFQIPTPSKPKTKPKKKRNKSIHTLSNPASVPGPGGSLSPKKKNNQYTPQYSKQEQSESSSQLSLSPPHSNQYQKSHLFDYSSPSPKHKIKNNNNFTHYKPHPHDYQSFPSKIDNQDSDGFNISLESGPKEHQKWRLCKLSHKKAKENFKDIYSKQAHNSSMKELNLEEDSDSNLSLENKKSCGSGESPFNSYVSMLDSLQFIQNLHSPSSSSSSLSIESHPSFSKRGVFTHRQNQDEKEKGDGTHSKNDSKEKTNLLVEKEKEERKAGEEWKNKLRRKKMMNNGLNENRKSWKRVKFEDNHKVKMNLNCELKKESEELEVEDNNHPMNNMERAQNENENHAHVTGNGNGGIEEDIFPIQLNHQFNFNNASDPLFHSQHSSQSPPFDHFHSSNYKSKFKPQPFHLNSAQIIYSHDDDFPPFNSSTPVLNHQLNDLNCFNHLHNVPIPDDTNNNIKKDSDLSNLLDFDESLQNSKHHDHSPNLLNGERAFAENQGSSLFQSVHIEAIEPNFLSNPYPQQDKSPPMPLILKETKNFTNISNKPNPLNPKTNFTNFCKNSNLNRENPLKERKGGLERIKLNKELKLLDLPIPHKYCNEILMDENIEDHSEKENGFHRTGFENTCSTTPYFMNCEEQHSTFPAFTQFSFNLFTH